MKTIEQFLKVNDIPKELWINKSEGIDMIELLTNLTNGKITNELEELQKKYINKLKSVNRLSANTHTLELELLGQVIIDIDNQINKLTE